MIAVGVMSGTSGDGADAAAIELDVPTTKVKVLASRAQSYAPELRERVLALGEAASVDPRTLARIHAELGDHYARLVHELIADLGTRPDVIALHGQTIAHLPADHVTFQIGDAARVARRTGVPTVSDLRSAAIAAGGPGAPLVPFADHLLFASLAPVAVLNIGGIANVTIIPSAKADDVVAFDTGPGNMVIDGLAALKGLMRDADGAGAAQGHVDDAALSEFLSNPYFARRAPKSTGREDFGGVFAQRMAAIVHGHGGTHEDALATATMLTARTIADALRRETRALPSRVLVAGGGTRNPTLMRMLKDSLAPEIKTVETTDAHGVPADLREAVAFAILGAYRLRGLPNTLPRTTGASRSVSGGALHVP